MTRPWGRSDRAGTWLYRKPICSLAVALLAPLGGAVIAGSSYAAQWTPLERLYLGTYVRSAFLDGRRVHRHRALPPPRSRRGHPDTPGAE
jgi:hypothetical protein